MNIYEKSFICAFSSLHDVLHDVSEDNIPTYLATLLNPEEAQPTYSIVDVTNDQLTIKTYQLDNTLVDSFTITE